MFGKLGLNSVHPRVCGEQLSITANKMSVSGSSPRVRGTVAEFFLRQAECRFIPACAGNSHAHRKQ